MTMVNDELRLAADFPPASDQDWRRLVDGVLKGAPFEKLIGKTADGLSIAPIYPRAKGAVPIAGRPATRPWQILQRIDHPDPATANAQALRDLENGATGLTLVFTGAIGARGFGLDPCAAALEPLLAGIFIDAGISIELEAGPASQITALLFAENIQRRGLQTSACNIRFGLDPIGACAVEGAGPDRWPDMEAALTGTVRQLLGMGFRGPFAVADGRVVHDAGGSEAQELAFVLASATAYLRALESAGLPLEQARKLVYARLAADADQFLTMAKFRALRLLWARIETACGLTPEPIFICAETAWRMMTQREADVNMLRATMASFAAGLGGADAITVLPHSLALGLPDPFARRVARNTQLVLLDESNLAKVSDPAAGSGGIEALTGELCTAAWQLFQEIESTGGSLPALQQNLVQRKVAATRAARDTDLARRRQVLTGATEFPNLRETAIAVLQTRPVAAAPDETKTAFDPLPPMRLAAPFEALRDRSDAFAMQSGGRPKVFLANLGTAADFTARASFARSFFETGGIEAVEFLPSLPGSGEKAVAQGLGALATAFRTSGAALACLCSSDKVYALQAIAAAQALQEAGASRIYLAGRAGDHEAALRTAGVSEFVFAGSDALASLQNAWRLIEG